MYQVNLVYDDEEMLEFYEWEDDDYIIEIDDLSMYRVSYDMLKDFMYGKLFIEGMDDCMFIVGDGLYHRPLLQCSYEENETCDSQYPADGRVSAIIYGCGAGFSCL